MVPPPYPSAFLPAAMTLLEVEGGPFVAKQRTIGADRISGGSSQLFFTKRTQIRLGNTRLFWVRFRPHETAGSCSGARRHERVRGPASGAVRIRTTGAGN